MTFTVATWNIWGTGVPWRYGTAHGVRIDYPLEAPRPNAAELWERRKGPIARELKRHRPDVVLLQESQPHQARALAEALGFRSHQAIVRSRERARAVLASPNWSIDSVRPIEVPCAFASSGKPRFALACEATGPDGDIRLLNAHLSLDPESRRQSCQILRDLASGPRSILAGDLNEGPDGDGFGLLLKGGWVDSCHGRGSGVLGFTAYNPVRAVSIDHVMCSGGLRPVATKLIGLDPDSDGFYPSDHAGVLVRLEAGTVG